LPGLEPRDEPGAVPELDGAFAVRPAQLFGPRNGIVLGCTYEIDRLDDLPVSRKQECPILLHRAHLPLFPDQARARSSPTKNEVPNIG